MNLRIAAPQLEPVIRALGDDFLKAMGPLASALVPIVHNESAARGVDHLYVWWNLISNRKSWSSLVGRKYVPLDVALRILVKNREVPDYRRFTMPDGEEERLVDDTILASATWASTVFEKNLAVALGKLLAKYGRDIEQMLAEQGQSVSSREAKQFLWSKLLEYTESRSHLWRDGTVLYNVLHQMLSTGGNTSSPV